MNRRIDVKMGRTINIGDFENKRIEIGISRDIKDADDIVGEIQDTMDQIDEILDEEEAAILEEKVNG
jgi:hypothetical protein